MYISVLYLIKNIKSYWNNPLYKNSFFIALGRFIDVGFGFFFWTIAARLYSITDVGIATALISSLGLVIAFSRFGFDTAIIRFMPLNDHNKVFNTCLWITNGATIAVSLIYLFLIDFISPELVFIKEYIPIFILFAIANSITLISGNAFLSLRKADLKFIQNLIMGIRLPLLIPLVFLGSLGLFFSVGITYFVASFFALILIKRQIHLAFQIDRDFTKKTFRFSLLNYLSSLFQSLPILIMPILIVNLNSPEEAALYYIAFAIGNLVLIIPEAMTTSFFVEGSHGTNLRKGAIRTLTVTYAILIPAIFIIITFGNMFLGLFGQEYLGALDLLRIIAVSCIFVTIYNLFIPLQNIRLKVEGIVVINLVRFVLLLGLSYIFLIFFGITGAGYAWLITYMILGIGILMFVKREGWI